MRMPFDVFFDETIQGSATHALVIGVGDYPHLLGGGGRLSDAHDGMGQLASPPLSARRLAKWLIEDFHNPEKPLASLSLLTAEAAPEPFDDPKMPGQGHAVVRAELAAVRQAVEALFQRANQHEDNLVLFSFCGHGIAAGNDTALLLADYGANELHPLAGAMDFRRLRGGLGRGKASEQIFFVDACRASTDTLLGNDGYAGEVVIGGGPRPLGTPSLRAPVFYATFNGAKAYARPGQTTIFTNALLKALADLGADDEMGNWRVSTNRLQAALEHVATREAKEVQRRQIPISTDVSNIYVHYPQQVPRALVYVSAVPPEDIAGSPLTYVAEGQPPVHAPEEGRNGVIWELELEAGTYDFTLAAAPAPRIARNSVRPPFRNVTVR